MLEIDQEVEGVADDVVRSLALDVSHEADATGIMLVAGSVQAGLRRLVAWGFPCYACP